VEMAMTKERKERLVTVIRDVGDSRARGRRARGHANVEEILEMLE
jgi:hypothetical protein